MNNILLLSAGRRVELLRAFKAEAQKVSLDMKVLAMDRRPELSAACRIADLSLEAPSVTSEGFSEFLLESCKAHGVGLVVPTIDTELLLLAQNRKRFSDHGILVVISDEKLVDACRDKRKTPGVFQGLGIRTPRMFTHETIEFPCFVKPFNGSSGIGSIVLRDPSMLTASMLDDESLLFMELVDRTYVEFTVDAYYDRAGSLRCLVPRQRLEVRAGEVSKGVTRKGTVYDFLLNRLHRLAGASGCITLQLFASRSMDDFVAIEINPRFGGGFPLSYSAGANYPGWLIQEYLFSQEVPFFENWEANLLMLRYDAKVLIHGAI